MIRILFEMLFDTFLIEVHFSYAVAALVPPADDVLGMAESARDALVDGLPRLRDRYLLQRVQSKDQNRGQEDKRLHGRPHSCTLRQLLLLLPFLTADVELVHKEGDEVTLWHPNGVQSFEHCLLREGPLRLREKLFYNLEYEASSLFLRHHRIQAVDDEVQSVLLHLGALVIHYESFEDLEGNHTDVVSTDFHSPKDSSHLLLRELSLSLK